MCVRGGDLCFGPGTCPPVLPHVLPPPSKAHGCVFFLFFLAFSSVFSLSLPFFPSLSLSLSLFFFFVFLPENQSEERGRVKRESARKAGTNHPACTFVSSACRLSSLPFPKPVRLLAAHSKSHPPLPVTGGLQIPQGQRWRWHRSGTKGISGKAAFACLALSNHHWRPFSRGTGARVGGRALCPSSPTPGVAALSRAVPHLSRATATGDGQAGACHAWVCVRACARVRACLVESQAERRGGTVGSWRGGAGELGGSLSLSLSPCWFRWLLSPCLSPCLFCSVSHGGSQNSALKTHGPSLTGDS